MCGIAGIMMRDGSAAEQHVLQKLASALIHRGPDGTGYFLNGSVGLLNTRLAIVDLLHGKQPFQEPCGAALVANGEIYNDLDLRHRLTGAPYQSGSDCESPLHLYRYKGIDFVDDLRGMYAIAVYDPALSILFLTRDPFGIKQLYYITTPSYFAFASEPQALKAAGLAHSHINPQKRSELLQLKFVTGSQTIYSDIQRLLPGETIVVTKGQIVERRRRRALSQNKSRIEMNCQEALHQLDEVLSESVAAHVRSDVPYGLFLSGGIDSSVLAILMSRISTNPVVAFTAAFPDFAAADETRTASRIAQAVNAEHHVMEVTQNDFWTFAPRVAAALDDPTADAAALPTFMLGEAAKRQFKVVLSGEGADEIFGGYSRYRRTRSFWRLLGQRKSRTHGVFDSLAGKNSIFDYWRDGLNSAEEEEVSHLWSHMQTLQAVDCAEWLPNDLLVKYDRCLMAHGIEGRTPFLDSAVASFAFTLPDEMKVKNGMGKWLLREWLSKNLPAAEAWAKKTGFNPPVGHWIAFHKAKIEALVLSQPGIKEMAIETIARKTFEDPTKNSQAAWSLLFYALWHSHHILGVDSNGSIDDVLASAAHLG
jgi:asparagine synthase (glutamine-hydrolysing)